jgi:hypothetical protein
MRHTIISHSLTTIFDIAYIRDSAIGEFAGIA